MDLVKQFGPDAAKLSINQYCPPKSFELAGKKFNFVLDTAEYAGDAYLNFVDEDTVEWSIMGGASTGKDVYECRKGDDYTYLVTYCLEGKTPRENHTWVIDREQELVTYLRCALGENQLWPYLIDSHFGFGYIKMDGKEHTDLRRHGFTDDCTGTGVKWVYGHELATVHIYNNSNWYRITYPKDRKSSQESQEAAAAMQEMVGALPGPDEPTFYVKIKEGMYFLSLTEQNMEKIRGAKGMFRSDTLCFLDNWKRLYSVGRGFGTITTAEGEDTPVYVMIGKYGVPEEVDEHFFTDPNPYMV